MRWTHDNWEQKITWMRERIHEKRGAVDLTDQEQKTVVDYLAKNFSDTTPKADPNGRLSRTVLQGAAAKYIAVDFAVPNSDAALHDITVDSRGIAWVNELNQYKLGQFDPKTYEFTEISPPPGREDRHARAHGSAGARRRRYDLDGRGRRQPPLAAVRHQVPAVHVFPVPAEFKVQITGNFLRADPNGKMVWSTAGTRIMGLNIETKQFIAYDIPHWIETKQSRRLRHRCRGRRKGLVRRARSEQARPAGPRDGQDRRVPDPRDRRSAPDGNGLGGQYLGRLP